MVYAGLMLPMSLMSYDERAKWDTFAAMLPYASREIVLSRYLGGWLCVALAGVLYAIGGALAAGQPFPPAERLVSLGWLFALTLAAQAILFPYLFRHGVEKARLYMMIFFVVLLAPGGRLGRPGCGRRCLQGSILFLLGAPAALVLALLLCLASVLLSVRQYVKRLG
ncbi:MAG: ABC-2 transporter permease [Evtepia gabavorous]